MKLCERYCRAVRLICVCGTSLWSVNLRTVCSSSLTQHPHKNTHSSSKLAWAFTHTHFITPLQGLHPLISRRLKSIYYLPLHNSPGRFILMLPACISFPFFASFNPPAAPFFFVILKEGTPLRNTHFLCTSLSLCVRWRESSRVGVDLSKCVWTHALPQTHNQLHTHSQSAKAEIDNTAVNHDGRGIHTADAIRLMWWNSEKPY